MITQEVTYYKDFTERTYTEKHDGVIVVHQRWDKEGKETYYCNGDYWCLRSYYKNGVIRRYKSNGIRAIDIITGGGIILERRFDKNGRMTYERDINGVNYDSSLRRGIIK